MNDLDPVRDPEGFHGSALLYLEGGLSPEEERAFEDTLRSSEEAVRIFAQAAQQDADLLELRRTVTFPGAAAVPRGTSRRRLAVGATRRRWRRSTRTGWLPPVAAAGILLTVSLAVTLSKSPSGGPARKETTLPPEVQTTSLDEATVPRREARLLPPAERRPAPADPAPVVLPAAVEPDRPRPVDDGIPEPALVPAPLDVSAKKSSSVAVEEPPGSRIVLGRVEGKVHVLAGAERIQAESGRPLAPGQGLETGPGTGAAIHFPDGTRLEAGPQTLVREFGDPAGKNSRGRRVILNRGRIAAEVARQPADRPMSIVTPHSEIKVLGTRLTLEVGAESTRVEVEEGRVRVTRQPDGAAVELSSGRHAVVSPGIPLANRPRERVIWKFDLEDGQRPSAVLEGAVAAGPPRAGNRFCLESSSYIAREYGPAINFKLDETIEDPSKVRLRFRYFAAGGRMTAQFFNTAANDNFAVEIDEILAGRWAWVDVPLSYFARWGGDRSRLGKGARLAFLNMFVVVRGNLPVYWDDLELVEVLGR